MKTYITEDRKTARDYLGKHEIRRNLVKLITHTGDPNIAYDRPNNHKTQITAEMDRVGLSFTEVDWERAVLLSEYFKTNNMMYGEGSGLERFRDERGGCHRGFMDILHYTGYIDINSSAQLIKCRCECGREFAHSMPDILRRAIVDCGRACQIRKEANESPAGVVMSTYQLAKQRKRITGDIREQQALARLHDAQWDGDRKKEKLEQGVKQAARFTSTMLH